MNQLERFAKVQIYILPSRMKYQYFKKKLEKTFFSAIPSTK